MRPSAISTCVARSGSVYRARIHPGWQKEHTTNPRPDHAAAQARIEVFEFPSLEAARPWWMELARTYKGGELTLDWEAHRIISEHFLVPRGYVQRVLVFVEKGRCIGVVPLSRTDTDPMGTRCDSFSDDFIIAREYFIRPDRFRAVLPLLPPHFSDDLSAFYRPDDTTGLEASPAGVIDLMDTEEVYLGSLRKHARHDLRSTLRRNEDLRSEFDGVVRRDAIAPILEAHLRRWAVRCGGSSTEYFAYTAQKIACDMLLMERAAEMGRLLAQYITLEGTLVAANFSVRREADRLDDYLCLRSDDPTLDGRALGILAIVRNFAECRREGIRYYDMSACSGDYKRRFGNISMDYLRPRYDDSGISTCPFDLEKAASGLHAVGATP